MADTPKIPSSIPDAALFSRGERPTFIFDATANGKRTGLVVIYLDTFEHEVYGDASEVATAFWLLVMREGKNLIQRTNEAEQKVADMERGVMIGFKAELRSRLAELPGRCPDRYDVAQLAKDLGLDD